MLILIITTPPEAAGQQIRGVLVDSITDRPLVNGFVSLWADGELIDSSLTGLDGRFSLRHGSAGPMVLRSQHQGYREAEVEIAARATEVADLRIVMVPDAVILDGVTARARRMNARNLSGYTGFFARREAARPVGAERIVTRSDPELATSSRLVDVLQHFRRARGCVVYYVNGQPRSPMAAEDILSYPAAFLEGVEFYRDGTSAPSMYQGGGCWRALQYSVVALWLRLDD